MWPFQSQPSAFDRLRLRIALLTTERLALDMDKQRDAYDRLCTAEKSLRVELAATPEQRDMVAAWRAKGSAHRAAKARAAEAIVPDDYTPGAA
jgi:hypothetical protein